MTLVLDRMMRKTTHNYSWSGMRREYKITHLWLSDEYLNKDKVGDIMPETEPGSGRGLAFFSTDQCFCCCFWTLLYSGRKFDTPFTYNTR